MIAPLQEKPRKVVGIITPCAVCGDLTRVARPGKNAVCLRHLKRCDPPVAAPKPVTTHRLPKRPKGVTTCPHCDQPRRKGSAYCTAHHNAKWHQWVAAHRDAVNAKFREAYRRKKEAQGKTVKQYNIRGI